MSSAADRNLLFGMLALQMDFVSREALLDAMKAWVLEKSTPLGQILLREQSIEPTEHDELTALVDKQLAQHGNDPGRSLAAISSMESVREDLQRICDTEISASLSLVSPNGSDADRYATLNVSVGESTSAGQRFRILRPHAKGGLGEVLVAEDSELHREVALKQIQSRYADDQSSRSRFVVEAEITGALEHPGIVPVYGFGTYADGRPFYAMRFIRGNSLEDAIYQFHAARAVRRDVGERTLQFRKLLARFIEVCNAIEYAHSRGVIHRDIKPGNIMLGKYGETLVVDWGLAKTIGRHDREDDGEHTCPRPSANNGSPSTQMGFAMGTPEYMSPEQAAGRHDLVGRRSDVYSLGATLYSLLTGLSPVADAPRDDLGEILRRVEQGEIQRPRQVKSDTPKPLDAICQKGMALRPADRYASPRALADDLEHYLADEPTVAHPDNSWQRLARFGRRHRAWAQAATAAAILIAVVATVAAMLVAEQRRVADRLAQKNEELFHSEEQAREAAVESAQAEKDQREKAEQLAQKNEELFREAALAREAAEESAQAERRQREKAEGLALDEQQARQEAEDLAKEKTELAESERQNREKADKLAEFLIGANQPEDPTCFTGATFFAPKADYKTFTVYDMLKVEVPRARQELHQLPLAKAAVFDSIGDLCRQLALFRDAERYLNEALRIRRKQLGPDDPDLATSCFHTAWYYHERGDFARARPLYLEALEIRRKMPSGAPLVADTLQNLAWLQYFDGTPEAVDECFDEALQIREQLLAEAPSERRAILLRNVAFTKLGMAAACVSNESVGERTMTAGILKAKRIASDPVLRQQLMELNYYKLADALAHFITAWDAKSFGEDAEAIDEFKKSLASLQGAAKAESLLVAGVNFELARALARLNRLQEAEQYDRVAIDILRREKMLQFPKQADRVNAFAELLLRLRKNREAEELWQEYLAAQKFRFGERHQFYLAAVAAHQAFRSASGARGAR